MVSLGQKIGVGIMCISPKHKFLGFVTIFAWPYWACQRAGAVIRKEDYHRSIPWQVFASSPLSCESRSLLLGRCPGPGRRNAEKASGGRHLVLRRVAAVC